MSLPAGPSAPSNDALLAAFQAVFGSATANAAGPPPHPHDDENDDEDDDGLLALADAAQHDAGLSCGAAAHATYFRRRLQSGVRTPHTRWSQPHGDVAQRNASALLQLRALLSEASERVERNFDDCSTLEVRVPSGFGMAWTIRPQLQFLSYVGPVADEQAHRASKATDKLARIPAALLLRTLAIPFLACRDAAKLGRTSKYLLRTLRRFPLQAMPLWLLGGDQTTGVFFTREDPRRLPTLRQLSVSIQTAQRAVPNIRHKHLHLIEARELLATTWVASMPDELRSGLVFKGGKALTDAQPNRVGTLRGVSLCGGMFPTSDSSDWPSDVLLDFLPSTVTSIELGGYFSDEEHVTCDVRRMQFPEHITSIVANSTGFDLFSCGPEWPPALTQLTIRAMQVIMPGHAEPDLPDRYDEFPDSLTSLTLTCRLPNRYELTPAHFQLPQALTSLSFAPVNLAKWILPASITDLTVRTTAEGGKPLAGWVVPPNLQRLRLSKLWKASIAGVQWPASLTSLTFGGPDTQSVFDCSLVGEQLPPQLRKLELSVWDQTVEGVVWPPALTHLSFGAKFNQSVSALRLPAGLQTLELTRKFDQDLSGLVLPDSLTALSLNGHFPRPDESFLQASAFTHFESLLQCKLPAALRRLTIPTPACLSSGAHPLAKPYASFISDLEAKGVNLSFCLVQLAIGRRTKAYEMARLAEMNTRD